MARTFRYNGSRDGFNTTRGLDRCPPRDFRRANATIPARRADTEIARLAVRAVDPDEIPAVAVIRLPYYT